MATKVVYTMREDNQELHKQFGWMNGFFQVFDRRYLLGLHRHGRNRSRLTAGEHENGKKEYKNSSEQAKEKTPKKMTEKGRASVEPPRNSFSSSCSSTAFSPFDRSKTVQTEWQIGSEPTFPHSHKKQPGWSPRPPDIRDVVKDSMTRDIHVRKDEQAGPNIKCIDSPRPFIHQKSVQYDKKDRNLEKVQKLMPGVKDMKEILQFSCDERESHLSVKSTFKLKELPRLSLDSMQNSKSSVNEARRSLLIRQVQGGAEIETACKQTDNQSYKPLSYNRPSSGVVARLMGLESLTDSICEVQISKIKCSSDDGLVSSSRWSSKINESTQNHASVSSHVHKESASQKQESDDRRSIKSPPKNTSPSVYGEMEKRLSALEFKTSAKDLRALKQILEAMQTTRRCNDKDQSLGSQNNNQPVSPMVKGTSSPKQCELLNRAVNPTKLSTDFTTITGLHNNNLATRKQVRNPTTRNKKATGRTPISFSPPDMREDVNEKRPISSTRLQRTKNDAHGQCLQRPSSVSSRIKRQSNMQPIESDLKTRKPETKPITSTQNNEQPGRHVKTKNLSQESESNTSLDSQDKLEITRNDQPKKNHIISEKDIPERLIEDKLMVKLAKLTMEQPSPVSVLDAFYNEDTPSPVIKKPNAFTDYENKHFDETEWSHTSINNLVNGKDTDQKSEFSHINLENKYQLVHQIELLNFINDEEADSNIAASPCKITNRDHKYINEILLTSGFLKDLDSAIRIVQFHPTSRLIKPELFYFLENLGGYTEIKDESHNKNLRLKSNEEMRRKMIFDSVNDILFYKLTVSGSSKMWTGKTRGRVLNGEKLLKELCLEIDNLQTSSESCLCDEDDEVNILVSADMNRNSEDWVNFCHEIPGLVLDIERLIFKDLIKEVVNAEVVSLQDQPGRLCKQLFPM